MTTALQLKPVFTSAGLAAMQAAHAQGLAVKISHVALGDALYDIRDLAGSPLETARAKVALQHEQLRVPLGPLSSTQANQVVVQAEVSAGDPPFWIGEVGFITDTGVLLAVWSAGAGPLGWRSIDVPWLIKFVLAWTDLPANSISVVMPEDDAALTALATSFGRLEGKVRHTVEVGGQLEWDEADNTLLTEAIGNMADARIDVLVATIDPQIAKASTYDIPFMAGWGSDFAGEDLAAQGYGAVVLARDITIQGEIGKVGVAPVGAALILDIEKNGASIYTTKPQIAAGATVVTAGVLDATKVNCTAADVLVFKVTQIGTTTKGQKATFTLKGKVR